MGKRRNRPIQFTVGRVGPGSLGGTPVYSLTEALDLARHMLREGYPEVRIVKVPT